MITTIIFDFSYTLLFPKNSRPASLNELHYKLSQDPKYVVWDNFILNEEILAFVEKNKQNFKFYIFTNSYIQDDPEVKSKLASLFEKIYQVSEMNFAKDDPRSFEVIAKDIKEKMANILYIDDTARYVEAAKAAGLKGLVYESNEKLLAKLNALLKSNE